MKGPFTTIYHHFLSPGIFFLIRFTLSVMNGSPLFPAVHGFPLDFWSLFMHFSILEYFGQKSITALTFGDDVSFIFIFFLSLLYTCSVFVLSTVLDFYSCKGLGSFFISVSLMAYLPTAQFFFLFMIAYFMLRQVLERLLCTYYWYFQWWTLKKK